MPQVSVLGIDIAKQIFHVVGLDDAGNIDALYGPDGSSRDWDGSLWGRPLLGAALSRTWAHREADGRMVKILKLAFHQR
jgi:hypothetical protein